MLRRLAQAVAFTTFFIAVLWWRADHDGATLAKTFQNYWFFAAPLCAFATYFLSNIRTWRWELFQLIFVLGGMGVGYSWTLTDPDIHPDARRGVMIIFTALGGVLSYAATVVISRLIDRYLTAPDPRAEPRTPGQDPASLADSPSRHAKSPRLSRRDRRRDG